MSGHVEREFILHFGEMGSRWGINRTVGQIYALLFLADRPLSADDICERLGFSRSNVSMGLKELQSWELVRRRHVEGDRREYFEAPEDLWQIVRTLVAQRKKREIDPTLTKLRELELDGGGDGRAGARIGELRELIETLTGFYEEMDRLDTATLVALLKAGSRLGRVVSATGRVIPLDRGRTPDTGSGD